MLLLLAACVKPAAPPETGAHLDSAESGGADSAAPPLPGPCGPWAGVRRVGSRWTFEPTDDYVARFAWTGTGTTTVTALDGPDVTLHTVAHYAGDEGSFDLDRTEAWRCDAKGAWWLRSDATTAFTTGGKTYQTEGVRSFAPGWLVRPVELPVQDAWVDRFTLTSTVNGQPTTEDAVECTSTVAAEETLHLPPGDALTRRVDVDCIGLTGTTLWLGENVGLVADLDLQVIGYDP